MFIQQEANQNKDKAGARLRISNRERKEKERKGLELRWMRWLYSVTYYHTYCTHLNGYNRGFLLPFHPMASINVSSRK